MENVFKLLRICMNMSVEQVANKLEVTSAYVRAIEGGKRDPSMDIIAKYGIAFDMRPSQLIYLREEAEGKKYNYQDTLRLILAKMAEKEVNKSIGA